MAKQKSGEKSRARKSKSTARSAPGLRLEPVNDRIAGILRQRIVTGHYSKGGELPPELRLVEEFGVSRHTVRAALQKLVLDGLIERHRGRGTNILKRGPLHGTWAIKSLDDLIGEFSIDKAALVSAGRVPAARHPAVAALFGLAAGRSLFRLTRVLKSEKGAYAVSNIFTTVEYGTRVPPGKLGTRSFIALIEDNSGVRAAKARQLASAAPAMASVAKPLGVAQGDPMLILQRTFLTRSGDPIVHAELHCRPDRYAQLVEFIRDEEPAVSTRPAPALNGKAKAATTKRQRGR